MLTNNISTRDTWADIADNVSSSSAIILSASDVSLCVTAPKKFHGRLACGITVGLMLCFRDYQVMPELDRYEEEGIDDAAELSDLSMSERMAAEREMRKRDREEMAATGRMRPGLLYGRYS